MLVDVNLFLNQNLVDDFEVISNENGKYFQIIQFKNPSIIRRVESEFRYLLSLF